MKNLAKDKRLQSADKPWLRWKHITKLDPDRDNPPELVRTVLESGTDALMISGTQGITPKKVERLLDAVRGHDIPIILEPVRSEAVTFDVNYLFVPVVVNSLDRWWLIGAHIDWLMKLQRMSRIVPWKKIVPEAYIVLNPMSAVAKVTKCDTDLSMNEVQAYTMFADSFLRFPIVYVEYSGTFGDPKIVECVHKSLRQAKLFYGGGIDSRKKAEKMARYATIIVGNVLYRNPDRFLETVL